VLTDILRGAGDDILEPMRGAASAEHRLGSVDDVAQAVVLLVDEGSRWITGQCIVVDGGNLFK